ncbi:Tetratricopeptide repeat (TPR)-like superfamily protein [Hibiscus syriacus]|uniref:Tetratricopeptide repeat (TPR)-like superfamily protein n=1 Tax=Hibiscus syriacus TaxID=106335 RepID=A0A6A3B5U4_HIBSY|nr:Tetratricopeptide repeat (TPR)-like superfamily protein [Hibiscus syriacus]
MRSEGPSPVVPSLMVGVLGLVIFGPTLLSVMEYVMPLFEAADSESGGFYGVLLVVLLFVLILVQLLSTFSPTSRLVSVQQTALLSFHGFLLLYIKAFSIFDLPRNALQGYLRKRLPGGDADIENHETSGLNDLNEPLLKCRNYDDKHSEGHRSKEITDEERRKVDLQWESLFSNSITQWTNWMGVVS